MNPAIVGIHVVEQPIPSTALLIIELRPRKVNSSLQSKAIAAEATGMRGTAVRTDGCHTLYYVADAVEEGTLIKPSSCSRQRALQGRPLLA